MDGRNKPGHDASGTGGIQAVPHYGKFRGIVIDNADPERIARVKVSVPALLGDKEVWAMPCLPYSPAPPGLSFLPQIGSQVWVEFEGGDLVYPIWTGCFWTRPEV
jgi:hypothetical protein